MHLIKFLFVESGCGEYILVDYTAHFNLAGEGCRKGFSGELVRIDSNSQQKFIQNWLNTLRMCSYVPNHNDDGG